MSQPEFLRASELFRTGAFRTAALAAAIFGGGVLLLFALIYWQTAGYERARIDQYLSHELQSLERDDQMARDVDERFASDLHRLTFAAIFSPAGRPIAGDLRHIPDGLMLDRVPRRAVVTRMGRSAAVTESVRAVGVRLSDGRVLIVGRSEAELATLRRLVTRALWLGVLPGLLLALAAGAVASLRTMNRVRGVNRSIEKIIGGDLSQRLDVHGERDALDQLAGSVNRVLAEIERLMAEMAGVGDDIAHNLRTPLTRARARLEGGRERATGEAGLRAVIDTAIADLDQAFGTITALLRIGQLESGRRREGFAQTSLRPILLEAADLYQPIAELRDITIETEIAADLIVFADRDLLFEAVVNLVDNAVKATPEGGLIVLSLVQREGVPVLVVRDSGAGIPERERDAVLRRFYRVDRGQPGGAGLGLSIAGAILRLHGFNFRMRDLDGGFAVEIVCGE